MYPEKLHGPQKERISTEMYLKTIYEMKEHKGEEARPVDIVKALEVTKSSVSEMLKKLTDEGYIDYESYGTIKLTAKGMKKAKNVLNKYDIVSEFLRKHLHIKESKIHDEACNLEHAFSDESIEKLQELMDKL